VLQENEQKSGGYYMTYKPVYSSGNFYASNYLTLDTQKKA
jgi:hypothetical protein